MSLTLKHLIEQYRTDADSHFSKLSYRVRMDRERTLARINREHGIQELRNIRTRTLIAWHREWIADGKLSMARSLVDRLRELFRFGSRVLEDHECGRLLEGLEEVRPQKPVANLLYVTREQASTICPVAREHFGWHSIALAQAFQFECTLLQKDVIGEIIPLSEPGVSDVIFRNHKWLRGIVWQEIDQNLILKHATSKNEKTEVDLKLAPLVLAELQFLAGEEPLIVVNETTEKATVNRHLLPASGPIIICDTTGLPWSTAEFRRKWRLVATKAGVPDSVKNRRSPVELR